MRIWTHVSRLRRGGPSFHGDVRMEKWFLQRWQNEDRFLGDGDQHADMRFQLRRS
jgi:hypothetical protein